MYDDAWYSSFVPELQPKRGNSQGHRRRESLLQQPNGTNQVAEVVEPLEELYEEEQQDPSPPEATLARRAKSYSDFYDIVREQLAKDAEKKRRKRRRKKEAALQALIILDHTPNLDQPDEALTQTLGSELLDASQQDSLIYRDQLSMTERHLETLIEDTNGALELLSSLAESFRIVEDQTTSFQSQCDDLISEQRRLQNLADEVGTDLHYYAYLDNVTRRLNAPGAGRLVDDDAFGDVLSNLDSCIAFMTKNPTYRDAESYLARYQALLTKALHLLEVVFTHRLENVSSEISKQIAATQSESARHALAYGRFEELILESYSLIPNIQKVTYKVYDQLGNPRSGQSYDIYSNTINNLFTSYLGTRDRDLRPIMQADIETFKSDAKRSSPETASRNFVKQCFERSYSEATLFTTMFAIEPQYSTNADSAFVALKSHRSDLVNGTNITPVATNLQTVLAPTSIETICTVLGWITNEYLLLDSDEEETPMAAHSRELTARLLTEHLWTFTDAVFEAEVAKSITKAPVVPEALKIGPVVNGVASSNAYPPVKRALELLVLFDQAMPKERCQRNSPVVFKIVKESIQALHRAEARIQSAKSAATDPDLFMIKNLLILKNELVSLEIGDIRSGGGMQHFGQIWDAIGLAQNWVGYFSSFIPGSSLWASSPGGGGAGGKGNSADHDASEQLDELLRKGIMAFTQRWGGLVNEAVGRKLGGKNLAKIERDLEEMLQRAFSNQPEVVAKLKEAIQINAQAQSEQKGSKITRV